MTAARHAESMGISSEVVAKLLNEVGIAAHTDQWDGFDAQMQGWNFSFWTDVHQA